MQNGSHYRMIWGKVMCAHGGNGVVSATNFCSQLGPLRVPPQPSFYCHWQDCPCDALPQPCVMKDNSEVDQDLARLC